MPEEKWWALLISKLPDIFDVLLVFAGISIVIVAFLGFNYGNFRLPILALPYQAGLICFGLIVMGIGLILKLRTPSMSGVPKATDFDVKITQPKENVRVDTITVEGSIKKKPPVGYSLWIFRGYPDQSVFPLQKCLINDDLTWAAPKCFAGGKPSDYRAFVAMLVGPDGMALISYLQDAMDKYIQFAMNWLHEPITRTCAAFVRYRYHPRHGGMQESESRPCIMILICTS